MAVNRNKTLGTRLGWLHFAALMMITGMLIIMMVVVLVMVMTVKRMVMLMIILVMMIMVMAMMIMPISIMMNTDDGDYDYDNGDDNDDGDDDDESAEVTSDDDSAEVTTDDEEQCTDIPLYTGSPVSCGEFNSIFGFTMQKITILQEITIFYTKMFEKQYTIIKRGTHYSTLYTESNIFTMPPWHRIDTQPEVQLHHFFVPLFSRLPFC